MPRKKGTPSLRRHKPSGQGVVTLSGKDHYLGAWPTDQADPPTEVQSNYDREVGEWLARGRTPILQTSSSKSPSGTEDAGLTVAELLAAFARHAEHHYRHPDGKPTSELRDYVNTLRPLNHAYGKTLVANVGPLALKAVRELMVKGYDHPEYGPQRPLARRLVNQRIGRIVRVFKWGVSEELVEEQVWRSLTSVRGLQRGRTEARETAAIPPAPIEHVEAVLPHLSHHLAGAAQFQLRTGARPGEALSVRLVDLDRTGGIWVYKPVKHKGAWRGKQRVIAVGPRGQAVLRDFVRVQCPLCGTKGRPPRLAMRNNLCGPCSDRMEEAGVCGPWQRIEVQDPDAYLFSPALATTERHEDMRAKRKSKVQPSQRCRKKKKKKRQSGEVYDVIAYGRAIARACEKAEVPVWKPNQLRHTHATEVRRIFGLEGAQVALGHSSADTTQIYAERDAALAARVAAELG